MHEALCGLQQIEVTHLKLKVWVNAFLSQGF